MQKNIYVSIIVLMLLGMNLSAQKTDQVTLHNGTTIRGNIVKIIPESTVTINDHSGNTWVYNMDEVKQIDEVDTRLKEVGAGFSSGWVNMTSIGFLAGSQSSDYIAPFSMQNSLGYRNNSGIYTGLLLGLEFIDITHIPMMLDFQYTLRNADISPVLIARAGYMMPSMKEQEMYSTQYTYSGGVAGAFGVGLKIRTKDIFAWDVNVLYRYMQINYTEANEWQSFYTNDYKDIYNRLELRVGIYLGK
jgi:hypothetical protein